MSFTGRICLVHTDFATAMADGNSNLDLGNVEKYSATKADSLECMQYPDTDARWQEYFDLEGSTKNIKVSGTYIPSDNSWQSVMKWKERAEAYVNGYIFDNGLDIWLAVYYPNFFGTNLHLWMDRPLAPLLEMLGGTPGIDVEQTKLPISSLNNCPICVTIESLEWEVLCGTSPFINWSISAVQRLPMQVDLEDSYL